MPAPTRRRSNDPHRESWSIFYGDVRIGTIGKRVGVPIEVDQWGWSLGFRPRTRTASIRLGCNLRPARAVFEAEWAALRPQIPAGAFEEYRRDSQHRGEIRAILARGERLPSETPSSLMRCVCGVTFDSHKPSEAMTAACTFMPLRPRRPDERIRPGSSLRRGRSHKLGTGLFPALVAYFENRSGPV
jgi:hypothetical protein